MPVQYQGVIPEHLAVRSSAGIFDVSHMGQLEVRGPGAVEFLEGLLSNHLDRIGPGRAQYTLLLDERGCPIDDLIAYRFADEHVLLVVNASRVEADREWLEAAPPDAGVELVDRSRGVAMLALQGPLALGLVGLPALEPFAFADADVCGVRAIVARTGYTGEPGVELIVAAGERVALWDALTRPEQSPPGSAPATRCGSRCATRSTATTSTRHHTALEAGLGWVCALDTKLHRRRGAARPARRGRARPAGRRSRVEGRGIPRPGMAVIGGRRGHERHDVAVARRSASAWPTCPERCRRGQRASRSTPAAATVAREVAREAPVLKETDP